MVHVICDETCLASKSAVFFSEGIIATRASMKRKIMIQEPFLNVVMLVFPSFQACDVVVIGNIAIGDNWLLRICGGQMKRR